MARDFGTKFQDEKAMSTSLLAKINHLNPKLEAKENEIKKLKEEAADREDYVNDLTINLATAMKMSEMEEEDREGATLSVPQTQTKKGKGKGKAK
jgi:predicted nuclease with TOPRIM domain